MPNYQEFKSHLFNPKSNKKALFEMLKLKYTFNEQQSVLRQLPKSFIPFVVGDCMPRTKEKLGDGKDTVNYGYKIAFNWYCLQVMHFHSEINRFLRLREEYEKKFLLGNYVDSSDILRIINNEICYSLWTLENEFLQVQFEKGLEFNFKLLNSSQQLSISDRSFNFLVYFFSVKVEEDISYFNYQNLLNSSFTGVPSYYVNFFNYRLNPMNNNFHGIDDLFSIHSNYSILDRYLLIRNALVNLITQEGDEETKDFYIEKSKFLSKYINDPLLKKVKMLLDIPTDHSDLLDNQQIEVIDLYSKGEYYSAIKLGKKYLLLNPNDFNILELYVKSHLHLKIEIESVLPEPCFLDSISKLLYKYLSKVEDPNESFLELLTQANTISNFDYSQQIASFLERNKKVNYFDGVNKGYFYSNTINPLDYINFQSKEKRNDFLINKNSKSVTADFFLMINERVLENNFKGIIPENRMLFYRALAYYNNHELVEAKADLERILHNGINAGFLHELVVDFLFKCYVALAEVDSAIDLYVHTFMINEMLVLRIDCAKAVENITKQKFKNVRHNNVNFPIFMYFATNEIHIKFIAYDLFMRSVNASRPIELLSKLETIGNSEILFLKTVATSKIISRKVLVFKNSLQVIRERIEICQNLSKLDKNNLDLYSKEISELTKRLTVQQRIKEIDQSMIYVDENGIIGHELSEINKSFNRFRGIAELLNSNKMDATGIGFDALVELMIGKIDTDTYKKSIRKTDIHFEHFTQLFVQVRDKFLFSNYYGLDYYLSQRIRHGTIIGQLRKQFQELNLVTSKSSESGDYLPNLYWSEQHLTLVGDVKDAFEVRMTLFSENVDNLINHLKDNFIQIKTEDPKTVQSGWFDFMYIPNWHKDVLRALFRNKIQFITDFHEFIASIFDLLWDMTTQNLKKIRTAIDTEVKITLINHLDELETDLKEILKDSQSGKIFKNIADCRTNVQSEVTTVIRWFNKSKNDEIDFTLADAFNTSLTIVNNINSPYLISFTETLESETLFKGAYFTHFVDLLKIFITNAFNYFKNNDLLDYTASVNFHLEETILIIDFSNPLADDSYDKLLEKIEEIKVALLSTNYTPIRGEIKSGFYKANNIIKNVFRDKMNEMIFDLQEDSFNVKMIISVKNLLI